MFKTRVALLGVLALFIASGIAASTASAGQGPYWHVNGSKLGQGAIKQVKLQAKGVTVLKSETALGVVTIECHNSYSEGATIEGQGNFQGQDKGRVVFEQCETFGTLGCEKVEEPIKTNQLKSYLAYNADSKNPQQKFVDVFVPQQGAVFVPLKFTVRKGFCPAEGKVEGSVAAEVIPIERESQELLVFFPGAPISEVVHEQQSQKIKLTVLGEPAVFSGAFGARLATNEQWGVFAQ